LPKRSRAISPALSVERRGHAVFQLTRPHDLEGMVAKRLDDPYASQTKWLKIKNPDDSQKEGRGELFDQKN
jgi:ATP-dependent DNA ligase